MKLLRHQEHFIVGVAVLVLVLFSNGRVVLTGHCACLVLCLCAVPLLQGLLLSPTEDHGDKKTGPPPRGDKDLLWPEAFPRPLDASLPSSLPQ